MLLLLNVIKKMIIYRVLLNKTGERDQLLKNQNLNLLKVRKIFQEIKCFKLTQIYKLNPLIILEGDQWDLIDNTTPKPEKIG